MKKILFTSLMFLFLGAMASADVYIYNTTDERMSYQVILPNGDTQEGSIDECRGYYPEQTNISTPEGKVTTFKVMSESGASGVEVKAPYSRCYVIYKKEGALKFEPVSWFLNNGQQHVRKLTILNVTGETQTFDLIDEKEMRKITLAPGEQTTVEAKNGFSGSSGFHHLKFANGHRINNAISSGYFTMLYMDKRDPGKVQAKDFGHLTIPRNMITQ